jgi:hypothetical protein
MLCWFWDAKIFENGTLNAVLLNNPPKSGMLRLLKEKMTRIRHLKEE